MFRKITAAAISILLAAGFCLTAVAAPDSNLEETYKKEYAAYKTFYSETYKPSYYAYNAKLKEFAQSVKTMQLETMDDYNRVMDFINRIKAERKAFFGDRVTPGTSRYDVPHLRDAMYDAAEKQGDFVAAIDYCGKLTAAVQRRVDFLAKLSGEIGSFEVNPSEPSTPSADVTAQFVATKWSNSSFGFVIVLTNNTNKDINGWDFAFNFKKTCTINSAWINGGSLRYTCDNERVSLSPRNEYQNGYTIPAGGSIMMEGSANGNANSADATHASLNGQSVEMTVRVN